jgi:sugar phosphate permease
MYLARALLGLAEGVSFPASTSVLSQWLPRKSRARFQGLNLSAIAAGPLIATPISVWIMSSFGWEAVFYSFALLGYLWAAVWIMYSKENPSLHKGVNPEELAAIQEDREVPDAEAVDAPMRSKAVWGLAVSYFCFTYTFWLFLNWLPTYLVKARGFTLFEMGFFASIPWLASFITINLAGWISDTLVRRGFSTGRSRRLLIHIGLPGMAVSIALAAHADNAHVAIALITLTMMLAGINFPSFWSLPMDMHAKKAGLIAGIMNTGGALASILAPVVTGYVAMLLGWSAAMYLASALALVSVVVIYFTAPKSA